MTYTIAKDFSFCYGHRVWSQELVAEFSENSPCKCRHLHGHEAKVTVHLTSRALVRGMVTDFNHLSWLKKFLDQNLDHKFVIDAMDPLCSMMVLKDNSQGLQTVTVDDRIVGHTISIPEAVQGAMREYLESFFIVDFVPTSENFGRWLFDLITHKMRPLSEADGFKIAGVEWWESPKSRSVFIGE